MGLLSRIFSGSAAKAAEGEYRDGPYQVDGGWLPAKTPWNFWQMGMKPQGGSQSAMVEACVGAYAQTVAMCPGSHWRYTVQGGRKRVTNSALSRIIKQPNDYQSISDFLLNLVRNLMLEGNAYAYVVRNSRFEPIELHLTNPRNSAAILSPDGQIFYYLAGNPILDARLEGQVAVPARDVLHVRMHTDRHPLVGDSPLASTALQLAASDAAMTQQLNFFLRQSRPSFILSMPGFPNADQRAQVRASWQEQSVDMAQGGVPIIAGDIKAQQVGATAKDSQLAEILQLSDAAIANSFRVPPQILGSADKTPYASTEALMQSWRAGGLGFVLNHIEEALGLLFKLSGQPEEYVEFDTAALMRSAFKDRVEAWSSGVNSSIFGINDARADFELETLPFGDEPWMQMQDLPLSVAGKLAQDVTKAATEATISDDNTAKNARSSIVSELRSAVPLRSVNLSRAA